MKFLYGLILALIFFEGFISQCKGAGGSKEASTNANIENLPIDVLINILLKAGFTETKNIAKADLRILNAVKRMIQGFIIHILPMSFDVEKMTTYDLDGETYLKIHGLTKILKVFKSFGKSIMKIKVDHTLDDAKDDTSRQIYESVIANCAKHFTELEIVTKRSFLHELSKGGKIIQFPNVKKLVYRGPKFGNSHDLNSIFPKLENLTLYSSNGVENPIYKSYVFMQINMTCLANVAKLQELKLEVDPKSYHLDELENIFKKNKQLSTLAIVFDKRIDILRSIEKHVKSVQNLHIWIPLNYHEGLNQFPEKHSFNMTKLKRLNLKALHNNIEVINFINSFENIQILDAMVSNVLISEEIGRLNEIKELIIYDQGESPENSMKAIDNFGEKKQLNTIRWVLSKQNRRRLYESEVIQINKRLRQSHKPTWEMDFSEHEGRYTMTLMRVKKI